MVWIPLPPSFLAALHRITHFNEPRAQVLQEKKNDVCHSSFKLNNVFLNSNFFHNTLWEQHLSVTF